MEGLEEANVEEHAAEIDAAPIISRSRVEVSAAQPY